MPVYDGSLDNIVGYVSAKDVLALAWEGRLVVLEDLIRPPLFLPESTRATQILEEMRRRRTAIAFVVDEHGGLSGLLTLRDLIEEVLGVLSTDEDEVAEEFVRIGGRGTGSGTGPRADPRAQPRPRYRPPRGRGLLDGRRLLSRARRRHPAARHQADGPRRHRPSRSSTRPRTWCVRSASPGRTERERQRTRRATAICSPS